MVISSGGRSSVVVGGAGAGSRCHKHVSTGPGPLPLRMARGGCLLGGGGAGPPHVGDVVVGADPPHVRGGVQSVNIAPRVLLLDHPFLLEVVMLGVVGGGEQLLLLLLTEQQVLLLVVLLVVLPTAGGRGQGGRHKPNGGGARPLVLTLHVNRLWFAERRGRRWWQSGKLPPLSATLCSWELAARGSSTSRSNDVVVTAGAPRGPPGGSRTGAGVPLRVVGLYQLVVLADENTRPSSTGVRRPHPLAGGGGGGRRGRREHLVRMLLLLLLLLLLLRGAERMRV